jgi:hypothetical protein
MFSKEPQTEDAERQERMKVAEPKQRGRGCKLRVKSGIVYRKKGLSDCNTTQENCGYVLQC